LMARHIDYIATYGITPIVVERAREALALKAAARLAMVGKRGPALRAAFAAYVATDKALEVFTKFELAAAYDDPRAEALAFAATRGHRNPAGEARLEAWAQSDLSHL
jgi:hypothetical protein